MRLLWLLRSEVAAETFNGLFREDSGQAAVLFSPDYFLTDRSWSGKGSSGAA